MMPETIPHKTVIASPKGEAISYSEIAEPVPSPEIASAASQPRNDNNLTNPKYTLVLQSYLPKFDRSVSWLCWAYNEEKLIRDYLIRADKLLQETVEDYEIVLIDDGSTDRTFQIASELTKELPALRVVRNSKNMDVGIACRRALMNARKEYLFWQTVDWAYDFTFLRIFLELLKSYDIVAGVRNFPHLSKRSDTFAKALVSLVNYVLVRTLFRLPLRDFQNVVFYPTKLVQSLTYESASSFVNPEGLIKAYWKGKSLVEVPIPFLARQMGKAKGTRLKSILASIRDVFELWFRWTVLGKRGPIERGFIRKLQPEEWQSLALETYAGA